MTWSFPTEARPRNSVSTICSRSKVNASACRTALSANWPVSQRIQIWRWVDDSTSSTVKSGLLSSASPPINWNCTMASTAPPCMAVTMVPMSSKIWNSVLSRSVWPPHHVSLRSNRAPVDGL